QTPRSYNILIVNIIFFQQVICEESGKNLSRIPTDLLPNVTILSLKNNKITLKDNGKDILPRLTNLTVLYLNENMITVLCNNSFYNLTKLLILDISNNHISIVHPSAFAGLNQLTVLNLSDNRITQLDSDVFSSLKSLRVLNLQNNFLKSFHIKSSFKLATITLAGNPWNCSCALLDLQIWLTASNVTMENENNTICTFPKTKEKFSQSIQKLIPEFFQILYIKMTVFFFPPICFQELPLLGKSWTFLVGVLGFVLSTTFLIFTAIKCPTWYHYLISYSHRRLEENDPEITEQEFSADMSSFPAVSDTSNEDPIVIFEKTTEFEPGEDGFIEDKYIDSYITEES
uniref:Leucine rich repeat containing 19 n=1 Tax=Anser brachyrhynchus TaxID=132585 RepID=A0A8B9CBH0_9AVES